MADQRFFDRAGPFTLAELAAKAGGTIQAGSDPDLLLYDIAPLDQAGDGQLSFLDNRKYLDAFGVSKAAACVVHPNMADRAPSGIALILSNKPYRTYAQCAQAFYPVPNSTGLISATAHIDPSTELGAQVQVDAGVVIEFGARIGARTRIAANAVIGRNVVVGTDCTIGACASLSHCLIGDRVTLYPGVRIGQDGFGFAMDVTGHVRVPQVGRVIIEDDVEVGANVTIDRGAGPDTVIGRGCMIDNLVQIGHNVTLGAGCVLVAQSGISGSTRFEKFAVLAAQAGVAGHLTIGAGARIAAQSGVMRDVPAGTEVFGTPAQPKRQYFRQVALLAKLARGKSGRGDEHDSGSGSE